jgi:threonine dehydratase
MAPRAVLFVYLLAGLLGVYEMTSNILPISDTLRVYDDILQVIGKTPLVRLQRLGRDLSCPLYAKVEFFNPGGR